MKPITIIRKAPIDWEKTIDRMPMGDRDKLRQELEGIATRTAMLAGYLDERHGCGCGDQGHKSATKTANRIGRLLWCKGFGYNGYHKITI